MGWGVVIDGVVGSALIGGMVVGSIPTSLCAASSRNETRAVGSSLEVNPLREGGVHGGDVVRVSDTDRTVVERGCDPSLDEGGEERERERETHRSCSRW